MRHAGPPAVLLALPAALGLPGAAAQDRLGAWRHRVSRLEGELGALSGGPAPPGQAGATRPWPAADEEDDLQAGRSSGAWRGNPLSDHPWPPRTDEPLLAEATAWQRGGWPNGDLRLGTAFLAADRPGHVELEPEMTHPRIEFPVDGIPGAENAPHRDDILMTLFTMISVLFFAFCVFHTIRSCYMYANFKTKAVQRKRDHEPVRTTVCDYMTYRMSYWFVNTPNASFQVITGTFLFFMLFGSLVYYTVIGVGLSSALHKVIAWLVSPDSGVTERSRLGAVIGVFLSLAGLLLFALMLSMVQEKFTSFLKSLTDGHDPIVEVDHIVVIGLTDQTMPLVEQLCLAHEDRPERCVIAVLAEKNKTEAEKEIMQYLDQAGGPRGSRLLVRSGTPDNKSSLEMVAARYAKQVIITVNPTFTREQRDAYTMQALISLRTLNWPAQGSILLMTALPRHIDTFQEIGGGDTYVLSLDHVISNILLICSERAGLAPVIDEILGFEGSELYVTEKVPQHLVNTKFQEASFYYPQAVVVGTLLSKDPKPKLCTLPSAKLSEGDKLLILAEDTLHLKAQPREIENGEEHHELSNHCLRAVGEARKRREQILVIGWNELVALMLFKLDRAVAKGTQVFSYYTRTVEDREKRMKQAEGRYLMHLNNITMNYIQGDLCSIKGLDALAEDGLKQKLEWKNLTRIFVLSEDTDVEGWRDDATTMGCAVLLRTVLRKNIKDDTKHPPIVLELHSQHSQKQVQDLGFENYVVTSSIPSMVMATVARQPLLKDTFRELFSNRYHPIALRRLDDYVPQDKLSLYVSGKVFSVTFYKMQNIIQLSGDVLIGWSKEGPGEYAGYKDEEPEDQEERMSGSATSWDLNPDDKGAIRSWDLDKDMLIVIRSKGDVEVEEE